MPLWALRPNPVPSCTIDVHHRLHVSSLRLFSISAALMLALPQVLKASSQEHRPRWPQEDAGIQAVKARQPRPLQSIMPTCDCYNDRLAKLGQDKVQACSYLSCSVALSHGSYNGEMSGLHAQCTAVQMCGVPWL